MLVLIRHTSWCSQLLFPSWNAVIVVLILGERSVQFFTTADALWLPRTGMQCLSANHNGNVYHLCWRKQRISVTINGSRRSDPIVSSYTVRNNLFSFHNNHGLHTVERTVHRILYSVVSRLGAALVPVKTDTWTAFKCLKTIKKAKL